MLASLLILIGLAFDFYPFKGLIVGMDMTKPLGSPLGAVGFLFASIALLLLQRENGDEKSWGHIFGLICAGLTFLIGGAVFLEYALRVDFGIDRLLFPNVVLAQTGIFPGRPIFLVSVCLTILGIALLAIRSKVRGLDLFVFGTLFVGLIALIEYIYGPAHVASLGSPGPFPLPAAILLILLSMGYLTARPESHFMAPISSPLAGGLFARRFFPAAILLPLLVGWLEIIGQRAGWYTNEFGRVLFSASNILIFIGLIYWNVKGLNEVDLERYATHIALRQSDARFRLLFNATPAGLLMVAHGGRIFLANATAENLFGAEPGQLTGKQIERLLPERFRAQHPMFRQLFENEMVPLMSVTGRNLVGLRQDGSEFSSEISLSPIETSEGGFTLASITDITERKHAEDEIRSLNASLEQRVAERTQQLEFERARWQGIVEGMAEEVWSCDAQGRMSLLNLGSASMMGLEPFKDKSVEEVYQDVEIFHQDGRPRPPEEAPLLRSLRGEVVRGEEVMRHRQTGVTRYRQFSSAPTRDETGAITGAVAVARDITEQKKAEEGLHRYELLSGHSKDIVLFLRVEDLRILEANVAAVKAYGYSHDELLKLNLLDLCAPEARPLAKNQMEQIDSGGLLFETTHMCKGGSTFPVEASSQSATIGGIRMLISIVRDITERKGTELALHESEQRFALAFHASPVGIRIFRFSDNSTIDANDAFLSIIGYSREEMNESTPSDLNLMIDPDQPDKWFREVNEHGAIRNLDVQLRRKSGDIAHVLLSLVKIDLAGESVGMAMVIDITKRKRAEAALQQSEENFSKAFMSSPVALLITRISDGRYMEFNDAYCNIVGYERDELLGHRTTNFNIYLKSTNYQAIVEQLQAEGSIRNFEMRIRHRSGAIRHVVAGHELIKFSGEECILSTLLDITDRKRAENALRTSEERYRAVFENALDAIIVADPAKGGRILSANPAAFRMFGFTKREFLKQNRETVVDMADPNFATLMKQREKHGHATMQLTYKRRNGERFLGELSSVFYGEQKGRRSISIIRDITERKRVEEQVSNALHEKEVLLKEIHHRVKNNLQVISSLLRLQSSGINDPTVRELFGDSQRRVRAMALIHEQLYQSSNLAKINMRDYIASLVDYLRKSYPQTISDFETHINAENIILEMDQAMPLGLLINELVSNSLKYAFPAGIEQQKGQIWINAKHEDGGLTLIVGDNGVGLPDDFDIKHTTSMGLQLVDSFVAQLHGQLTIQRKPGTVFTIFIPDKGILR
jgi:PAS domain S-box-containing protein